MTAIGLRTHVADAQPARHYNFAEFYAEYAPYMQEVIAKKFSGNHNSNYVKEEALWSLQIAFSEASNQICKTGCSQGLNTNSCKPHAMVIVGGAVFPFAAAAIYPVSQLVNPFWLIVPDLLAVMSGASLAVGTIELVQASFDNRKVQKQIRYFDENNQRFASAFGSKAIYDQAGRNIIDYVKGLKPAEPAPAG